MAQHRLLATALALLCATAVHRLADARITEAAVVRDDRRVILLANPFGCAPSRWPVVGTRAAVRAQSARAVSPVKCSAGFAGLSTGILPEVCGAWLGAGSARMATSTW